MAVIDSKLTIVNIREGQLDVTKILLFIIHLYSYILKYTCYLRYLHVKQYLRPRNKKTI